jgi:hypothetical protein
MRDKTVVGSISFRPTCLVVYDCLSTDNRMGAHVVAGKRVLISNGNPMEAIVGFSRAVRVGSYIAVGGTAPVDQSGKTVGVGDVFIQTKNALKSLRLRLKKQVLGFTILFVPV